MPRSEVILLLAMATVLSGRALAAQPVWEELGPPASRSNATVTYDPAQNRVLLYGGQDDREVTRDDIWEFRLDGTAWHRLHSPGPQPSPRYNHSAIFDPTARRIVIYGGEYTVVNVTGDGRDDVWSYSLDDDAGWTRITTEGESPGKRWGHVAVYDPLDRRMIVYGGSTFEAERAGDVWSLSLDGPPVWTRLETKGAAPEGRTGHVAVYRSVDHSLVIYGGEVNTFPYTSTETWTLSLDSLQWSRLTTSNPPYSEQAAGVYDERDDRLILLGGFFDLPVQALALATGTWSTITAGGAGPGRRTNPAAAWIPGRDEVLLFGDQDRPNDTWALSLHEQPEWNSLEPGSPAINRGVYDPAGERLFFFRDYLPLDELWCFNLKTSDWRAISLSGAIPSSRQGFSLAYDYRRSRILLWGGYADFGTPLSDLWSLSLSGPPTWSRLNTTGPEPPGRLGAAFAYDPSHDDFVLQGGTYFVSGVGQSWLNDVWTLNLSGGNPSWFPVELSGPAPEPRESHSVVYDARRARLVYWGGEGGNGFYDDAWALQRGESTRWVPIATRASRPLGRSAHGAGYDVLKDRMLVFSGSNYYNGYLSNDLWELQFANNNTWREVQPGGYSPPTHREYPFVVYDPALNRLIVAGGTNRGRGGRDVWTMTDEQDPAPLAGLSLTPPDTCLLVESSIQAVATGLYADGKSWNLSPAVLWTSSDPNVVAVSFNGTVHASGPGTATLSARLAELEVSSTISVAPRPSAPEELPSASVPSVYAGVATPLSATDMSIKSLLESQLGPPDPSLWRLAHWSAVEGRYLEAGPVVQIDSIRVGQGYWLITRDAHEIIWRGLPTFCDFRIDLPDGPAGSPAWNQLGNPFQDTLRVEDIRVSDGDSTFFLDSGQSLVESPILVWSATRQQYMDALFVPPGQSFWVHKLASGFTRLVLAPPDEVPPIPALSPLDATTGPLWTLTVTAAQKGHLSHPLKVGVANVSGSGWNRFMRSKPPDPPAGGLSLWVRRTDLGRMSGNYVADFRGPDMPIDWSVFLSADPLEGPVTLTFRLWNIPAGQHLLLSTASQSAIPIDSGTEVTILVGPAGEEMTLSYRGPASMADASPTAPIAVPNPFQSRTSIVFPDPEPGDVKVDLIGVTGRKLRTLHGQIGASSNHLVWDGQDETGRSVPAGLYWAVYRTRTRTGVVRMVKDR